MRSAVVDMQNAAALFLDFYDRTRARTATWVSSHTGLIPWVRTLVGRSIHGWQSYGAWAYDPAGITASMKSCAFSLPNARRSKESRSCRAYSSSVTCFGSHGISSWLVGLSGVGKTRLVQALFDERIGEASLDASLAGLHEHG